MKIFVSGCYDILHGGHVEFFTKAKELGDHLTVCVASDESLWAHKKRKPSIPVEHKVRMLEAMTIVDQVLVSTGNKIGLNFEPEFRKVKPDLLVVTEDDRYEGMKKKLCKNLGCKYVKLPKTLDYEKISTTDILGFIKAPTEVPLRIDIAGGWLDVPKFSRSNGFIVNCSIEPLVSLKKWNYNLSSGLGGSAAYAFLAGKSSLQSELELGVGWQDPAVIMETGLCVWQSGKLPKLIIKRTPDILDGRIALLWTQKSHDTPGLVDKKRDYDLIQKAGDRARQGVEENNCYLLCEAVNLSYKAQILEGMEELPSLGEVAKKYCGGGYGGYALYIFLNRKDTSEFLGQDHSMAIKPYIRGYES